MSRGAQDPAREIADSCIAFRVRLLNRAVTRIYDDVLREQGVTIAQVNLLVATSLLGEIRATDLSKRLSMERSTLSRNLERLRDMELLEALDSEDARSQPFRATAQGKRLLKRILPAWREAQASAEELLGTSILSRLDAAAQRVQGH